MGVYLIIIVNSFYMYLIIIFGFYFYNFFYPRPSEVAKRYAMLLSLSNSKNVKFNILHHKIFRNSAYKH